MSEPKERPILFSGEMVRAILAGRKTMTRRVIKQQWPAHAQPKEHSQAPGYWIAYTEDGRLMNGFKGSRKDDCGIYCPFGVAGVRLWVRESFSYYHDLDGLHPVYMADTQDHGGNPPPHDKWRPSIHMPRWASRITLEVVSVRVERLQDISADDCIAEGVTLEQAQAQGDKTKPSTLPGWWSIAHRHAFAFLWDTINAKRGHSWESNPFVWRVEFKRL